MPDLIAAEDAELSALFEALPGALDGGSPLALGFAPEPGAVVPDETAVVVETSGSSGVPKRVMLSADALRASAVSTAERIGAGRWMLALQPGYVAGLQVLVRSLLAGTEPVVLRGGFTPDAFIDATGRLGHASRYTSLVPAQLATLLDAAESDDFAVAAALRSYQAILIGGQALPAPLRERAAALGVRIVRTYGSSETSGGCVYDGVPLDGVQVEASAGEVRIAGPMLATGYLGDAELTSRVFEEDAEGVRWYRTGDAGVMIDGVLRVDGRIDNVIVSGGVNVSLDRVERVVRGVPGLEQAVVIGVPDERWGEASVVFAAGDRSEAELLADARDAVAAEIGKPARPARLVLLDALPMLPSGKPDREALRRLVGPA